MTCGIYCITNQINGKQYVGQSVDIEERFKQHIQNKSDSEIHKAIKEYGVHNFRFEPLVECSQKELDEQEVKFIRLLGTYENGYNQTRGNEHSVFNVEYNYKKYSELKKEVETKKDKIRSLKEENNKLKKTIDDLEDIISNLEDNQDSLRTKNMLLSKEKQMIKKRNISLRKDKADLKKLCSPSSKKEWASLQNKIRKLNNKINLLKSEKKELHFENERLRKNMQNYPLKNNIFEEIMEEQV